MLCVQLGLAVKVVEKGRMDTLADVISESPMWGAGGRGVGSGGNSFENIHLCIYMYMYIHV